MISILSNIDNYVLDFLYKRVENPLLKKVIVEEIIFSNNLVNIFQEYLSYVVLSGDINNLNILIEIINKLSNNSKKNVLSSVTNAFTNLINEEQLFLILNITETNKCFYSSLNFLPDNKLDTITIHNILMNIGTLLENMVKNNSMHEYIIKYIHACNIIDENHGLIFMEKFINNKCIELINDEKLLSYFITNYSKFNKFKRSSINNFIDYLKIKLDSIIININTLPLDTMDMAFEIYKLGKLILDCNILYDNEYFNKNHAYLIPNIKNTIELNFNNEQLEYIAQSIHTCLMNNNVQQAHTILGIIYYLSEVNMIKLLECYNKWLSIRIMKRNKDQIIKEEDEMWTFHGKNITKINLFDNYNKILNTIVYSQIINNDLQVIKVNKVSMDKVHVTLMNKLENTTNITHHPKIQTYIHNLDKYMKKRSVLQHIVHDNIQSKITFTTAHGSIKCSLYMGSILLYLYDGDKTSTELSNVLNEECMKYLEILEMNNVLIHFMKDGVTYYKYVEPYGNVVCDDNINILSANTEKPLKIVHFTDVIITTDSRIMKETKLAKQIHILELERKIQEFMGDEYVRTIFYQRLESLKSRYYIEDDNSIIKYII